jgi:hypothetical protein
MIPKSMLLGMLKPLLPKLEGFLKDHPKLKENEESRIVMRIEDSEIKIEIYAYEFNDKKEVVAIRQIQDVDPKSL